MWTQCTLVLELYASLPQQDFVAFKQVNCNIRLHLSKNCNEKFVLSIYAVSVEMKIHIPQRTFLYHAKLISILSNAFAYDNQVLGSWPDSSIFVLKASTTSKAFGCLGMAKLQQSDHIRSRHWIRH